MGIMLQNKGEWLVPLVNFPAGLDPADVAETTANIKQPTADKDLAVVTAPFNCKVVGLVMLIAVVGAAGTSVDLKEEYWIDNDGIDGNQAPVQMTSKIAAMDISQTPDYIPVAGTKLIGAAMPGARARIGDQLVLRFDTTGTPGTATRPQVTPIGIVLRAEGNVDPMNPFNVR